MARVIIRATGANLTAFIIQSASIENIHGADEHIEPKQDQNKCALSMHLWRIALLNTYISHPYMMLRSL